MIKYIEESWAKFLCRATCVDQCKAGEVKCPEPYFDDNGCIQYSNTSFVCQTVSETKTCEISGQTVQVTCNTRKWTEVPCCGEGSMCIPGLGCGLPPEPANLCYDPWCAPQEGEAVNVLPEGKRSCTPDRRAVMQCTYNCNADVLTWKIVQSCTSSQWCNECRWCHPYGEGPFYFVGDVGAAVCDQTYACFRDDWREYSNFHRSERNNKHKDFLTGEIALGRAPSDCNSECIEKARKDLAKCIVTLVSITDIPTPFLLLGCWLSDPLLAPICYKVVAGITSHDTIVILVGCGYDYYQKIKGCKQ